MAAFHSKGHATFSSPLSIREIISSRYLLYATSFGSYIWVGVPEFFTCVSVIVIKVDKSVPANSAYSRAHALSSGSSRIVVATFRGFLIRVVFFILIKLHCTSIVIFFLRNAKIRINNECKIDKKLSNWYSK